MRITRNGNRELRAGIVEETWICLRVSEQEVLRLSLVEATELVDVLRGQIGMLAFGIGRAHRAGRRRS